MKIIRNIIVIGTALLMAYFCVVSQLLSSGIEMIKALAALPVGRLFLGILVMIVIMAVYLVYVWEHPWLLEPGSEFNTLPILIPLTILAFYAISIGLNGFWLWLVCIGLAIGWIKEIKRK